MTVKATDGVGRSTTKSVGIDIARDTTQPVLTVSGPLRTAPAGWVDQHNYDVTAAASDSGYGVTNLKLLIDGQQVGSAATQTCPDGGCSLSHTFIVNTANYGGGRHTARILATDGAGNTTAESWTINVNPDGNISTDEATATLTAVDSTSAPPTVAPNTAVIDPGDMADGNNPGLQQDGDRNHASPFGVSKAYGTTKSERVRSAELILTLDRAGDPANSHRRIGRPLGPARRQPKLGTLNPAPAASRPAFSLGVRLRHQTGHERGSNQPQRPLSVQHGEKSTSQSHQRHCSILAVVERRSQAVVPYLAGRQLETDCATEYEDLLVISPILKMK